LPGNLRESYIPVRGYQTEREDFLYDNPDGVRLNGYVGWYEMKTLLIALLLVSSSAIANGGLQEQGQFGNMFDQQHDIYDYYEQHRQEMEQRAYQREQQLRQQFQHERQLRELQRLGQGDK
jgi:hypothetical protein